MFTGKYIFTTAVNLKASTHSIANCKHSLEDGVFNAS